MDSVVPSLNKFSRIIKSRVLTLIYIYKNKYRDDIYTYIIYIIMVITIIQSSQK